MEVIPGVIRMRDMLIYGKDSSYYRKDTIAKESSTLLQSDAVFDYPPHPFSLIVCI